MKKILKYICVFLLLVAIGEFIKRIFLRRETPSFVESLYQEVDTNDSLKYVIGGINNYQCKYDEDKINHSDTISFKSTYEGDNKTLIYEGKCIKIPKGWAIKIETETIK
jgi:hypothetical protein